MVSRYDASSYIRIIVSEPTLLRIFEKGRPRSLANDHVILDEVAIKPMVAQMARAITMEARAVVPAVDLVAWRNISMNGKPVGDLRTLSRLPMPKSVAISMPNPRQPLISMLVMMDRGTEIDGFSISSDILGIIRGVFRMSSLLGLLTWTAASAPSNILANQLEDHGFERCFHAYQQTRMIVRSIQS